MDEAEIMITFIKYCVREDWLRSSKQWSTLTISCSWLNEVPVIFYSILGSSWISYLQKHKKLFLIKNTVNFYTTVTFNATKTNKN